MTEFTKMDHDEYREMKKQERNEVFEMLSESTQSLMDSAVFIAAPIVTGMHGVNRIVRVGR